MEKIQAGLDAYEKWFKETFAVVDDTKMTIFFVTWIAVTIGTTVWLFRADQRHNAEVNDEKVEAETRKTK